MERAFQFFIVDAVCGHVGRDYGVVKSFAITAADSKDAAAVCRTLPRVKHHFKYAIRNVRKVSLMEYVIQYTRNAFDPYLTSENVQDQNRVLDQIHKVSMENLGRKEGYKKTSKVSYKRYVNNYLMDNGEDWGSIA